MDNNNASSKLCSYVIAGVTWELGRSRPVRATVTPAIITVRTPGQRVKRTLRRAHLVLSLLPVQGTNAQKFRALLAWLGVSERAAAGELGISQTQLRRIKTGENIPEYDTQQRIQAMSRRWNLGEITPADWPKVRKPPEPEPEAKTGDSSNNPPQLTALQKLRQS